MQRRIHRITFATWAMAFYFAGSALAERYLSVSEVQRLCFPRADRFEERTFRPTPEQVKSIEKMTKGKVRSAGDRLWLAHQGTNLLGVLFVDQVFSKHELIDYAVAVSPEGKILQVEILEYREQYGGQIRQPKWRDQFKGKTASARFKLNDDIYNISGATISCRNVTDGIKRVVATFEVVVRPKLAGAADKLSDTKPSAREP